MAERPASLMQIQDQIQDDKPMSGLLSQAPQRAILAGLDTPDNDWPIEESMDELEQLASTAGVTCADRVIQRMPHPHPATLLGTGKVKELAELVEFHDCDAVIFDLNVLAHVKVVYRLSWRRSSMICHG